MQPIFEELYTELSQYIDLLRKKYLNTHITNQISSPKEYEFDVKVFCILSHAAFEDFVETTALKLLGKTVDEFVTQHRVTEVTACLLHFKCKPMSLENVPETIERSFDYIRKKLEDVKNIYSKDIYENHGVSLKHLVCLLPPIAIDIIDDTLLLSSLDRLSKERGFYAHKFLDTGKLHKCISPEDTDRIVQDCLQICEDIKQKVIRKL